MMKVLVTGGAGFIGSNFIHLLIRKHPDWQITNFDLLTYAGNPANLKDIENHPGYKFIKGDIADINQVRQLFSNGFDYVINFAAETHVDRSLYEPQLFIRTNVMGTQVLLDQARQAGVMRFLQVSTDEVYGSIEPPDLADEQAMLKPGSPYAAAKAAADLLCLSYVNTYDMPVIITRTCNNYGPYQFPEKVIPFFITKALHNESLPVYGDGLNIRDWLYVDDNCEAILMALEKGLPGKIYNIAGDNHLTNLELTKAILTALNKPESLIKFVEDRPGHDRRYAVTARKLSKSLGWQPQTNFSDGLSRTIDWYITNENWWRDIKSGEYLKFYEKHYKNRK
jgi:dTDP-glucose 4,6-dehydratase